MNRIPTTHGGSLVRPPRLRPYLLARYHRQPYDEEEFERTLAGCVDDAVRSQVEAGVDFVSDGEFGKSLSWATYIRERLSGFDERPPREGERPESQRFGLDRQNFAEFFADYEKVQAPEGQPERGLMWVCTGPVAYSGQRELDRDIRNLRASAERHGAAGAFLPVVAPASIMPVLNDEYYGNEEEFVFAVAAAVRSEYRAIVDSGLMLQVDDAFLTMTHDSMVHRRPVPATEREFRDWAELRIEALNVALEGIPPERVRYHLCWGSWNGPHTGDVPLRDIIDLVLRVRAGHYVIEQAGPRHEHEWRLWGEVKVPEEKVLVPGVISHATNVVEHPELVRERLVRLARLVGRERVMAGTDCGFAQSPFTARVHPTIMWAKLRAQAEGARLASRELWG